MNQNVKLWLRAANPFTPPRGMIEAQRAARVGAVALVIAAVQGLASIPQMSGTMARSMDLVTGIPAESQAFTEALIVAMGPMMVVGVVAFSVVYLVLAVVQWRQMTWAIPAIMLGMLGYSLFGAVNGLAMFGTKMVQLYTAVTVVQWIIMLAMGFVYAAAFRGGRMLDQ